MAKRILRTIVAVSVVVLMLPLLAAADYEKIKIAVLDFQSQGESFGSEDVGGIIAEWLITHLVREGRFEIVERRMLAQLLEEQKLGAAGVLDSDSASQLGKIIGVQAIVSGSVINLGGTVSLNARLVDVENASIIAAENVKGGKEADLQRLVEDVARRIIASFPLEGYVVQREGSEVILDLGRISGARAGMVFLVYEEGKVIKHPKTGEILDIERIETGRVRLVEVQEKISRAEIVQEDGSRSIAYGQLVKIAQTERGVASRGQADAASPAPAPAAVVPEKKQTKALQQSKKLLTASLLPKSLGIFDHDMRQFVALVEETSHANITLEFDNSGKKRSPLQLLDEVGQGTLAAGIGLPRYWSQRDEAFALIEAVSGCRGTSLRDHYNWLVTDEGKVVADLFSKYGVVGIPFAVYGPKGLWARTDLAERSDLRQVKLRASGHQLDIFTAMGADVQKISAGKMKAALASGQLGVAEFFTPPVDVEFGLAASASHFFYPSVHAAMAINYLIINEKVWLGLADQQRQAITQAGELSVQKVFTVERERLGQALAQAKSAGVAVGPLPQAIADGYCRAERSYYQRMAAKQPGVSKMLGALP